MTRLFDLDAGPEGPEYGTACPIPKCGGIGFSRRDSPGIWCVLHHPREVPPLAPDVAQWIGPSNAARQSEEKGPR